jgi:hypothetical protein
MTALDRFDDNSEDLPQVRLDVAGLCAIKARIMANAKAMFGLDDLIGKDFELIEGYRFYRFDHCDDAEKSVDQACWTYLSRLFSLEKYMLCTDHKKMREEIAQCRTPKFTQENAEAWLASLKGLIQDNVRILVKKVFAEITEGTYHTGSGYRAPEKKRNNNGIDERFILSTRDYSTIFGYSYGTPTVTDDLEKVCYILAGKAVPDKTAKDEMRLKKIDTFKCDWFSFTVKKNGNTHYWLADEVRNKLNLYGPEGAIIGENIKIKIVERSCR